MVQSCLDGNPHFRSTASRDLISPRRQTMICRVPGWFIVRKLATAAVPVCHGEWHRGSLSGLCVCIDDLHEALPQFLHRRATHRTEIVTQEERAWPELIEDARRVWFDYDRIWSGRRIGPDDHRIAELLPIWRCCSDLAVSSEAVHSQVLVHSGSG